ncbi:23S rRNA methyltransferase [Bdellovibrio bacteriovorus]|uniref:23S rRNA methyltransferase n=1 Tax=Bdellovibrio bacteriovorus TaxID=959 RepID=A0A150WLD5_BDEBC|nr:TrmH family RNA methyltransferase [Bdellovibrio bacteriovorus]KYG64821.1 23S rRNA methyltransferase [Bdellovibrio bacteriovorus]
MIEISSKSNDHFKRWVDISSARGIKKHGEFILMGEKLIEEFLKNPHIKVKGEILHEDLKSVCMVTPAFKGQRIPIYKLPKAMFNEVDVVGTHYNLLVLEAAPIESLASSQKVEGLEVVAPLGDPANLGAMARSALAFGASKLILTEETCNPYHPKAIKASAGALLKLPLYKTSSFSSFLQSNEELFALDMKGENVGNFKWPKDLRLAVGEEGPGFSGMKGLKRLSVPTLDVESLNATVAASIAFFTYASQHSKV